MHHATIDRVQYTVGIVAAGGITQSEKIPEYGHYLTTHGMGLLSYAEWMQVTGSVYILLLIAKIFGVNKLINKVFIWFFCLVSQDQKIKPHSKTTGNK